MKTLQNPGTAYLLDASLESMHSESKSWLSMIEFWGDELSFFYKLMHPKRSSLEIPAADVAGMDRELVKLNAHTITPLRLRLESHERMLSALLQTTSLAEEQNYREAHRTLRADVLAAELVVRDFKRRVFSIDFD